MSNSNKPHVHAEVIKAWADGKQIEFQLFGGGWCGADTPSWDSHTVYRVKPETIRYRVALMKNGTSSTNDDDFASRIEHSFNFVRWLTDWIEVEV